jgi:hypothetical protein
VEPFTPIFDDIVQELGLFTAAVYGIIWRFSQMEQGHCNASLQKVANRCDISRKSAERAVKALCAAGYIEDLDPGVKNRPHRYKATGKPESPTDEDKVSQPVLPRYVIESYPGKSESPMKIPIQETSQETSPANAGAAKPPPSDKPPKKPIPPAVQVFRENAHRYPPKAWYGDIAAIVGESAANLARWGVVVKAYVGCGWNPTNVSGMLDFFQHGETPKPGKRAPPDAPRTPEERRKRYASQPGVIT